MITPRDPKDHKAWLAYWSDAVLKAVARAIANPTPGTLEDHELLHIVRSTRILHSRALKVRPALRLSR